MPGFCWTLDLLKFPPGLSLFPKLSVSFKLGRGGGFLGYTDIGLSAGIHLD